MTRIKTQVKTEVDGVAGIPAADPRPGRTGDAANLPIALGSALAGVALLVAGLTWIPGILDGPPAMQGSARGTALIVLVAAPLSIAAMVIARRGHISGLMLWLGAVVYLLYNAVLLLFATPYNRLFPLDVSFLALAIFTLIRLVMAARTHAVSESPRVRRWLAYYIWVVVVLNCVAWLSRIIPSVLSDRPESITDGLGVATNPVYVQDLGFWLPAASVIGWWLWSGRSLGIVLAGGLLTFWVLESVSIAVDQALGVAADSSSPVVSTALIPGFLVLGAAQALALTLHIRAVQPARASR
jgi:hypothetical protein